MGDIGPLPGNDSGVVVCTLGSCELASLSPGEPLRTLEDASSVGIKPVNLRGFVANASSNSVKSIGSLSFANSLYFFVTASSSSTESA